MAENREELTAGEALSEEKAEKHIGKAATKTAAAKKRKQADQEEKMTLEEAFAELDALVARLEDRDVPLEESFAAYQKGMALLKQCNDRIDTVEKKMLQISQDGELTVFE